MADKENAMADRDALTPAETRVLGVLAEFGEGAWVSRMDLVAEIRLDLDDLLAIGGLVERGLVQIEFYLATCRITSAGRAAVRPPCAGPRAGAGSNVIRVEFGLKRAG